MTAHNFAIEFYNEVQHLGRAVEKQLQAEAEARLQRVATNHRTLRAATVAIEQPLQRNFSHLYVVQIVVTDARQTKSSVVKRATRVETALQEAFTLLERQLALRYPPASPSFLLRAWQAICRSPNCQLWGQLTARRRDVGVA